MQRSPLPDPSPPPPQKTGTVGGVVGISLVYPLDSAKCRIQAGSYPRNYGPFDVIRAMVREGGVGSLYRGLLSPQAGFGVTFAISFAGYGQGGRFFRGADTERQLTLGEMTAAGAWAGVLQSPARQVFERVKSVMQVQRGTGGGDKAPYRWSGECVVQLIKKEGLYQGLFRGLDATVLRELPQFAVYYPIVRYVSCWVGLGFLFLPVLLTPPLSTSNTVRPLRPRVAGLAQPQRWRKEKQVQRPVARPPPPPRRRDRGDHPVAPSFLLH